MHKVVVSDTSCLITLSNMGEIELLKGLYSEIFTTPVVAQEFGENLPGWIKLVGTMDQRTQVALEMQVDPGEASAMVLALELKADLVILDDYKARKVATRLGLGITGTLGIFLKAKELGLVSAVKPLLEELSKTNFRISQSLISETLRLAGEPEV